MERKGWLCLLYHDQKGAFQPVLRAFALLCPLWHLIMTSWVSSSISELLFPIVSIVQVLRAALSLLGQSARERTLPHSSWALGYAAAATRSHPRKQERGCALAPSRSRVAFFIKLF